MLGKMYFKMQLVSRVGKSSQRLASEAWEQGGPIIRKVTMDLGKIVHDRQ